MYRIEPLADDIQRIELTPVPTSSTPWDAPRNVFLFQGAAPALVDTGAPSCAPQLLQALADLGVEPASIARIALTSRDLGAFGNTALFPNARVWSAASDEPLDARRAWLRGLITALRSLPDAPESWSVVDPDAALTTWFAPEPAITWLQDGEPLRLGDRVVDALRCDGLLHPGAAYFSAESGILLSGTAMALRPRPIPFDPGALLDAIGRLGALSVKVLGSAFGPVEKRPAITVRAASLYATNLRTNLQHVLDTYRSSIDIAHADEGELLEDFGAFLTSVATFDAVMREFVEAGVIHPLEGDSHPLPRYKMGAGSGRVRPRVI